MIRVKANFNKKHEDYIATKDNKNNLALSSNHMFAITTIFALSIALSLPSHITFTHDDVNNEQTMYLAQDEQEQIKNVDKQMQTDIGDDLSKENYEDYDLPKSLFTQNVNQQETEIDNSSYTNIASILANNALNISKQEQEHQQALLADNIIKNNDNDANDTKQNIVTKTTEDKPLAANTSTQPTQRPQGTWYQQTVSRGDNLSTIFTYLNLPYTTLQKIVTASNKTDLSLSIGQKVHFLIDDQNIVKELVTPINDNMQVRFTRMDQNDNFARVVEPINSHIPTPELASKFIAASNMPLAVEAQKRRALIQEQQDAIAKSRPQLVIFTVENDGRFATIARKHGLTNTEIATVQKELKGKLNLNKLKKGDSFRILFNGIGTKALVNAFEIKSTQGTYAIFRNPQDNLFYEENTYVPTAGIFKRFPLTGNITINSKFNPYRKHPVTRRVAPHNGVDFKASVGTPVYAPADGTVTFRGYQRAAGYYIVIAHDGPYSTVYMHLSKIEVQKGQKISVGQMIAKTGNTGRTTGPHLHYEVRINDRAVDPLKVDLPNKKNPALASRQMKNFKDNVKNYKNALYQESLAIRNN